MLIVRGHRQRAQSSRTVCWHSTYRTRRHVAYRHTTMRLLIDDDPLIVCADCKELVCSLAELRILFIHLNFIFLIRQIDFRERTSFRVVWLALSWVVSL